MKKTWIVLLGVLGCAVAQADSTVAVYASPMFRGGWVVAEVACEGTRGDDRVMATPMIPLNAQGQARVEVPVCKFFRHGRLCTHHARWITFYAITPQGHQESCSGTFGLGENTEIQKALCLVSTGKEDLDCHEHG